MKQRKKSLKLLLSSDFKPLEESKEGKLLGGFAAIIASTGNNCMCNGNNCDCNTSCDPPNNCMCNGNNCNCSSSSSSSSSSSDSNTGGGTTTSSPSSSSSTFGLFGFF